MKSLLTALVAIFSPILIFCQDITGLWTGSIQNDAGDKHMPYEVFISKDKGKDKYSGYSKTLYLDEGKECYSIKKLKINIAKDGKIVLLDASVLENDYPYIDKYGKQLNVLDLLNNDSGSSLDGVFVMNPKLSGTVGKVRLKKANTDTESSLMRYLQKISGETDITAIK